MRSGVVSIVFYSLMVLSIELQAQVIKIDLKEPIGENFIESALFQSVSYVPLTTDKANLISQDMEMKYIHKQFFVMDNKEVQCVYRFDENGKFLNTIGGEQVPSKQTNQPMLVNPIKFAVNPYLKQVDIYNFEDSEIRRYQFDGKRVDRINMNVNPADFIREQNGNYWIYMGWKNADTPFKLLQTDRTGKIIDRQKRLITKCTPTEGYAFYDSGNGICHWELLGNVAYKITGSEIKETYQFNFGTYALPLNFHLLDANDSFQIISNNGNFTIKKYLENKSFAYFFLNFNSPNQREMIHIIYDKKAGLPYIYNELANIGAFDKAQALTDDNELIFLVSPRRIRQLFGRSDSYIPEVFAELYEQISDIRVPVALKVKIGSAEE